MNYLVASHESVLRSPPFANGNQLDLRYSPAKYQNLAVQI